MKNDSDKKLPPHEIVARMIDSAPDFDLEAFAHYGPHPAEDGAGDYDSESEPVFAPFDPTWLSNIEVIPHDTLVACSLEPQNDTGNGQRLLKWFGADLLHVRDVGWHTWADTHWKREGGDEIATRLAQETAARIALEADVMELTPNEQQEIDAANDVRPTLASLEKDKGPAAKKDRRWATLGRVVAAGDDATAALAARRFKRKAYAVQSGNTGKIRGMLEQALPHRTVVIDDLDSDKLAFNVQNGTLRFVCEEVPDPNAPDHSDLTIKRYRVELHPHNRGDNISKVAPVRYNPQAKCPTFDGAVERFIPIEPVRIFLRRYHRYALTGLTGDQCFVFNYGTGSNWKSTFIELISRIMGPYCATIAFESLSGDQQRSGSQATPDLARLPGARLVRASEPERGVQFKEALIKSLTGGEPMLVRSLNKEFFEFRPTFKLVLSGNHKPEISGVDHGIWRRVNFVPWPVTISNAEKRPMDEVIAELWAERSGVLNWLVAGALDYLNSGLQTPQEVIDATAEYREEMDLIGTFLGQCVEMVPPPSDGCEPAFVYARQMYDAFVAWAVANAIRPWKEKSFAKVMLQKGLIKDKDRKGMQYLHVKLKNVPEAPRRRENWSSDVANDDVIPV